MATIPHPGIIGRLARAGPAGIPAGAPEDGHEAATCREYGFPIVEQGGRYVLAQDPDLLVPEWIEAEAPAIAWSRLRVAGFLSAGSTNDEAAARARAGEPEAWLACSERQTAGRGRKGRQWYSPAGQGLYFSLLLRPSAPLRGWPVLAHTAAVALALTFEELRPEKAGAALDLKWPNDVLFGRRKASGILLETASCAGSRPAAILGVGVNVAKASVPNGLSAEATSLETEFGGPPPRRQLLVRLLRHFQVMYNLFQREGCAAVLEEWKRRSSMWEGAAVWISDGGPREPAITCGLTEEGALRVRTGEGSERVLFAGDVTVRVKG